MAFFSDLFGGKSAMKSANDAATASAGYTNTGYTRQREEMGRGYGSADTILSGYEQPGKNAYGQYADSIGANGVEGYGRAKQSFDADPFRAGQTDATDRAIQSMFRRYNPTGQTGQQMTAVGRVGSDIYGQQVDAYRARLAALGQQGAQFGTARAGNAISQGQQEGQSYLGQNNQLGSIEANRIQGVQAARTQGQNNLMSGLGAIAGIAAAPFTGGASLGLTSAALSRMGGGGGGGGGGNPMGTGWMQPGRSIAGNWMNGAPTNYGSSWDAWSR